MAQITRIVPNGTGGMTTLRLIESTEGMARTNAAMPTTSPNLALPIQAALEMVKVGSAIAAFWLQHGTEQLALNSRMLTRTAGSGNWQERLEARNALLHDGFARLNQGMSRYAGEVLGIVDRSRQARAGRSTPQP